MRSQLSASGKIETSQATMRCGVRKCFPSGFLLIIALLCWTSLCAQVRSDLAGQLERVAALIRENRDDEAEQQLNLILKTAANQADALNLLGAIRAKQGKLDDAGALFARAVRSNGRLTGARMNLAQFYLIKGMPVKAIAELQEVRRIEPENPEAIDKLTSLLLAQNRGDEFIELIESTRNAKPPSAATVLALGDAYLVKRNFKRAQENYQTVLSVQSDNADAIIGLAEIAQLEGDVKAVADYLSRAKKAVPTSPDTLYRFALASWKAGRFEDANVALVQAVRLKPNDIDYLVALGTTWLKKPDLVEAEQAFRRALQLKADHSQAQIYLGFTLLQQKKYPEAQQLLEANLRSNTGVPETYYYLGLIAQEQNEDEKAIQLFRKTLELTPDHSEARLSLGTSYLKLKDYVRAQAELERAVELNPGEPKAHYQLAVLFARLKNPERAQEQMAIVERLKEEAKAKRASSIPSP